MLGAALVAVMATTSLQAAGAAAEEVLRRREARRSLLAFTAYTHPSWETGDHHRAICRWLEKVERGEVKRLAVFAPPRHGKSELTSRRFPAWYLGRHPDRQIICASAGGLLASDIGADVRDIVRDPYFAKVFPGVKIREDASAAGRWRTDHGGTYYAAGVGGTVVGRGANLAVVDDPHGGREDADSERMRDVVVNWFFGDLLTRLMTPEAIVLIQTRWHLKDLAGSVVGPRNEWVPVAGEPWAFTCGEWSILHLPAIRHEGSGETALWPGVRGTRFPLPRLHQIRDLMTKAGRAREWEAQYQQNPVAEEGNFIKRAWFSERYDEAPEDMRILMASDFAVSEKEVLRPDPDFTEHGVFGLSGIEEIENEHGVKEIFVGKLYVLDWWSGREAPDATIRELLRMWRQWEPHVWFSTKGGIKNAIEHEITRAVRETRTYLLPEWLTDNKDKGEKGYSFRTMASSGRIIFPKDKPWAERVITQSCQFPQGTHDDCFDTMANICRASAEFHDVFRGIIQAPPRTLGSRDYGRTRFKGRDWMTGGQA